jgi:hypothetical protein
MVRQTAAAKLLVAPLLLSVIRRRVECPRLDLKEVNLVSREVVTFLARCKEDGMGLNNCPAYIREWIARERTFHAEVVERIKSGQFEFPLP